MSLDGGQRLDKARNCLRMEAQALLATAESLDESFLRVVDAIEGATSQGRKLLFSGVGKNAYIAQKVAGTFNSTGVPAVWLDPIQAVHGDLGMCAPGDVALLFSNSGETEELRFLLPGLKRQGCQTVAVTARADSALATMCDLPLLFLVPEEACPLQLAPTSSTTAALGLGDALAMVFLEVRGFRSEDFARLHPSGTLGKSLLLTVGEIMRSGDRFACLPAETPLQEALLAMTKARCGSIALTEGEGGPLVGVFTDGDLRRCALRGGMPLDRAVGAYMTRDPKCIRTDAMAVEALVIFQRTTINDLIVVDEQKRPVGLVDGQDLPKLKLV